MASLYRDPNSPYWYVKYKSPDGRWRAKSTRFRHGKADETRKARELCAGYSLEEHRRSPQRDSWVSWVPDYLCNRYSGVTRRRMLNCWDRLSQYFTDRRIFAPQDLDYRATMEYLPWRKAKAAHNTALLELKVLGIVCREAIRRGIITHNPAANLGIRRERGREKPELSNADIAKIRNALKAEPAWMGHAFEIALHQGCRLSETAIWKDDLDLKHWRIHFRKTKGEKPFTVPLHPFIRERVSSLADSVHHGQQIISIPPNAARDFHRFFKKLDKHGVTFHSTRVTVASRLARSGYSITKAMRLLNHSSELVHRTYQRLQPEDVADAFACLSYEDDNELSESQD